ncbi:cupin domain-containing protein [Chlorobium sp. N1]|uniref:cupin domain-containing protein n=1 Tax=Chlorobium sp. N1 TaxID=2491138 RepID=UPI00103ED755|nr:cupin domain-containing protein [Chlorobium sp. N1]TCD48710.1 cupin domain-containing protein [Chlorobium sp. N1]
MKTAEEWIGSLGLRQHPEGGWYRESWRSDGSYPFDAGSPFKGPRSFSTAIYYLLREDERSCLHRIGSDELWLWHAGAALRVDMLAGGHRAFTLGSDPDAGEVLQGVVEAGAWFGASLESPSPGSYALVSCVVAPGFDFGDFVMAERRELLERYPKEHGIIEKLTR